MSNVENLELKNEGINDLPMPELHYVGLMFESKYGSTKENPKFYGKVYEYKTRRELKEGQVITIPTRYGISKVCVVKENIPEDQLEFKETDKIVEI
jgi:hypothetical protein